MRRTHLLWTRRPRSLRGRRATASCTAAPAARVVRAGGPAPRKCVVQQRPPARGPCTGGPPSRSVVAVSDHDCRHPGCASAPTSDQDDPIAEAAARGADLVQIFLGDPQGWKDPAIAYAGGAAALRAAAEDADLDLYVHAPYRLNVATANNRIRIPSRQLLAKHAAAAAEIGAKGLIVHGGHVLKDDDPEAGVDNWAKTFERLGRRRCRC